MLLRKQGIVPGRQELNVDDVWHGRIAKNEANRLMQSPIMREDLLRQLLRRYGLNGSDKLLSSIDDTAIGLLHKAGPVGTTTVKAQCYVAFSTTVIRLAKGNLRPDNVLIGECLYDDGDSAQYILMLSQIMQHWNLDATATLPRPLPLIACVEDETTHVAEATGTLKLLGHATYAFTISTTPIKLRVHPVVTNGAFLVSMSVQLIKIDDTPNDGRVQTVVAETRLSVAHNPASGIQVAVSLPNGNNEGHVIASGRDVKFEVRTAHGASVVTHYRHNLLYDTARENFGLFVFATNNLRFFWRQSSEIREQLAPV